LARQEKLFAKLRGRDETLAKFNNGELAQLIQDSRGTEEQRQKVKEVLAKIEIKIPATATANAKSGPICRTARDISLHRYISTT
jgi:hypothetical protein